MMSDVPQLTVAFDQTEADSLAMLLLLQTHSAKVIPRWQRTMFQVLFMAALAVFVICNPSFFDAGKGNFPAQLFLASLVTLFFLAYFWQYTLLHRLAKGYVGPIRVTTEQEGLSVVVESGEILYHWPSVIAIERRRVGLVCFIGPCQVLLFPEHAFADEAALVAFAGVLSSATGLPVTAARDLPQKTWEQPVTRHPGGFVRRLLGNLYAGLLFLFFHPKAAGRLSASALQLFGIILALFLIELGINVYSVGLDGQFAWQLFPFQFWEAALCLLCALLVTRAAKNEAALMKALLAMISINCVVTLLSMTAAWLPAEASWSELVLSNWRGFTLCWFGIAVAVALIRICSVASPVRRAVVCAIVAVLLVAPFWMVTSLPGLWVERYDTRDSAEMQAWRERRNKARKEEVLYAQPRLLDEALAGVAAGRPGVTDLYLVALGGDGSQDVFRREVERVDRLFAERFGTGARSVVLLNNPETLLTRPIANVTTLQRTLKTVGERMNRDEDVLFLFLTSHGAKDFLFNLELWPFIFDELTPQALRKMLDDNKIKNRVIVVSACYSGGFVPALADDDTLVMSASREDRNSYGCSHEAEWTFFGKAYFDEALRQTDSFEEAFALAKKTIDEREKAENRKPSDPQISVGKNIGAALARLGHAPDYAESKTESGRKPLDSTE